MGNVILFRAILLAITIIKKAFIIILSNRRRRQTEFDPNPLCSPSLAQTVFRSEYQAAQPPSNQTCRYLKSTSSSLAQCGVDNLRLRAPEKQEP